MTTLNAPCLHCKDRTRTKRRRRLCMQCYANPDIRQLYSPITPSGGASFIADRGPLPTPPRPTLAEPGSREKIKIMQARASAGNGIFNPGDKTLVSDLTETEARELIDQLDLLLYLQAQALVG